MSFRADRLRDLRIKQGFTQEELAEKMGVGTRMLPRYEAGETDPSAEVVISMARSLGVAADYLLGLVDEPVIRLREGDLNSDERRLLFAYRHGLIHEAVQALAAIPQKKQESSIAPEQPSPNS